MWGQGTLKWIAGTKEFIRKVIMPWKDRHRHHGSDTPGKNLGTHRRSEGSSYTFLRMGEV